MSRTGLLTASMAAIVLVLAPQASAVTTASVDGDTVRVSSGDEANTITLATGLSIGGSGTLFVEDTAGITGSPTCPQDGDRLECEFTGTLNRIALTTAGGTDTADFAGFLVVSARSLIVDFSGGAGDDVFAAIGRGTLDGGAGADRLTGGSEGDDPPNKLIGGPGPDVLRDNEGADVLRGGGGPDKLNGGDDRDRYSGGSGADRIKARDFTKDKSINCGPGEDRVRRDRFDPPARSC